MSQRAAEVEAYVEDVVVEQQVPQGPGFFAWLRELARAALRETKSWFSPRLAPEAQFVWNVPVAKIGSVKPETVYCVELPVSNPTGRLAAYTQAGVAPDHVVFVGSGLSLNDEQYDLITKKGALVHESKKGRRKQAERDLKAYFAATGPVRQIPPGNPYTYTSAPNKVTPEQLKEFVEAVARVRR